MKTTSSSRAVLSEPSKSWRIRAVLNMDSGTLTSLDKQDFADRIRRIFEQAGHDIDVQTPGRDGISEALQNAVSDENTDVLLAGGGDGTISGAAGLCWKCNKALAVIPGGTMNLFARCLRLPLELEDVLPALAKGQIEKVDIATANGRPFLHQYAIGLHPLMIRMRNEIGYGSKPTKIVASIRAAASLAWDPPSFRARLSLDGVKGEWEEVSALSVAATPFGTDHMPYSDTPAAGSLGIYTAKPLDPIDSLALGKDIMLGSWKTNDSVTERKAQEIELHCDAMWADANATIDGEVIDLEQPVRIQNHASALRVVIPSKTTG